MKLVFECNNTRCLGDINGIIHDNSFDVDSIEFDEIDRALSVPFVRELWESHSNKWYAKIFIGKKIRRKMLLKINQVLSFEFEDSQRINRYSFNILQFENDQLYVITVIPMKFQIVVEGINIQLFELNSR